MARMFQRHISPVVNNPGDFATAGVGSFARSLNDALIRNQKNKQAMDMEKTKETAMMEKIHQMYMNQKELAEDDKKKAPKPYYAPGSGSHSLNPADKAFLDQYNKANKLHQDQLKIYMNPDPAKYPTLYQRVSNLPDDQKKTMAEKDFNQIFQNEANVLNNPDNQKRYYSLSKVNEAGAVAPKPKKQEDTGFSVLPVIQ